MQKIFVLVAAGMMIAASVTSQEKEAANQLIGTWTGFMAKDSGRSHRFDEVWQFKDDKIIVVRGEGKEDRSEWKCRFDFKKTPMEIDLTPGSGPAAGKVLKGIYKVEGDRLTICYVGVRGKDPEKRERPIGFDAQAREDDVTLVFTRKKP